MFGVVVTGRSGLSATAWCRPLLHTKGRRFEVYEIPESKKLWFYAAAVTIFSICYLGSARIGLEQAVVLPLTPIDVAVPYWPWTLWIYSSHYLFVPLCYVVVRKPANYSPMLYSMLMATLISSLIFVLYPTQILRPEAETGTMVGALREFLYWIDLPTNCFPSLHVALALLGATFISREYNLYGIFSFAWSGLVIASTLTVQQHYFVDVIGGIVVALVSYAAVRAMPLPLARRAPARTEKIMNRPSALVTGASSGFGRAFVHLLLEEGYRVVATLRQAGERQAIFAEAQQRYGDQLIVASLDVCEESERAAVQKLVATQLGGRLDVLVNNAGYGLFGALEDVTPAQIEKQMNVNFMGLTLLTRTLLPHLRAARGKIVNLSSLMGYMGMPLSSLYTASKYAIEGLSESLYYELRPQGVSVSVIQPGGFRTDFADNLVWAENASSPQSAYQVQTHNYKRLREQLGKRPPNSIAPVVVALQKIVRSKNPPLRTRCGKDAHMVYWLGRLLPRACLRWISAKLYTYAFDVDRLPGSDARQLKHVP